MMLDVLVVDDSDLIRTVILKTLRLADVPLGSAYEAANGKEALQLMEDNWVDLVLADINMPVMDGVEMVERMHASKDLSGIPVIMVTTEGSPTRIDALHEQGIAAYIRKPFTPETLRGVVTDVTSRWAQDQHSTLVDDVVRTVLERFTFMYGEHVPRSDVLPLEEEALLARMTFTGSVEGVMSIAAPLSLCRQMAVNILGSDIPPHTLLEKEADALGEVLNMACGQISTALDERAVIDLTPPIVTRLSAEDWQRILDASSTFPFNVEGWPALLSLAVRPPK